ncbi:MAG: beta-1,6-N-acetylglucosaminyltransferase, partial [Actinomycetota bacterium]|nr:beta-1,6-N-acetylglucosaminyltransferase [Actinomycetota bacterium]
MRLVYIVLAHQLPEQLIRLVDRLEGPDVRILVHLDRNMSDHEVRIIRQGLVARPNVEFLPRHRCAWGAYSLVEATLEGLRRCRSLTFDYAVLISGQDYPIKSREQIDRYLAGLDGASLIHNDPFPVEFWHDGGWGRIQQ